jgi:hypothetical protein
LSQIILKCCTCPGVNLQVLNSSLMWLSLNTKLSVQNVKLSAVGFV